MFENKIIHIFDDDKFIDPAIHLFERCRPNNSLYLVITNDNAKFKYVTSALAKQIIIKNEHDILELIKLINSSSSLGVCFHAMSPLKQKIANSLNDHIIKTWFIWGYDLYNNWDILRTKCLTKATKQVLKKKRLNQRLKNIFVFNEITFKLFLFAKKGSWPLPAFIRKILNNNFDTSFYRAIHKMSIVVPVLPNEFQIIKKMRLNAIYAPFTYGSIEHFLGENKADNVLGKPNILVGNSADPTNNHIDVLKALAKINLGDRKVYVPLSYPDNVSYINSVIEAGNKYLGENFIPLQTFMPLSSYNEILLSCGTVIFNHIRQQGIGNIISAGFLGAKIYLNKMSPAYSYYKSIGITIYDTASITNISINTLLNKNQMLENRKIMTEIYSDTAVKAKVEELFNVLEAKQNN